MGIETLTFESETARQEAMDALDERDPANEIKLDEIMSAPIKVKDEAATQKTADQQPKVESQEPKVESKKEESSQQEEMLTIKKSDLTAHGFDTPGKLFKSYKEAQDLIDRQTKFIKEKIGGGDQNLQSVLSRAEKAEKELAELRKKIEKPAQEETRQEDLPAIPESVASKIKEVRGKLQELSKDPVTNEDEIYKINLQLQDLWLQENDRTSILIERANKRAAFAEQKANEATTTAASYLESSKKSEERKLAEENLKKEFKVMDDFMNKYSEFKSNKPMSEIEREYMSWAQDVTNLFYGSPINIESEQGHKLMRQALNMLDKGAPDITDKCKVAGIPIAPTDDIKKYLEICQLLDYRDGRRIDPVTGKEEIIQRYHQPSGKYIPDTFPTLEAAYEDRKIRDGFYEKRIKEAFAQGGESMAKAISKRDQGTVELDNVSGASSADAGLTLSRQDAAKVIDEVNEIEALRRKKAGDPSLYNKLNEAFKVMGLSPIDA